ncbi:TetR family transcriptional regulator C-terminal domain-containing protein [Paenibacillus sp.]|jgi:AcrR family transcriptional regulator|uniref:TetR/AcrR family transcriptional regulator n=1 Tax=Paenibacillus sp. TaxID=58172 RepID=UPI002824F41C|nr:TetR family transcriptional regulator C-terminal domain-containing protein [Paenibacillus sp.]MDR0269770.1 TetR/AcrR family transcriptional regulator [Paenibacillus sp.]
MSTPKGQQKREFILERAKDLFIQKGYAATSMEDLVHFTGISKGSIYYHFENKEDLFFRLIEKNSLEWESQWREKEKNYGTFSEKIYGITDHYVSDFQNPLIKISEEFFLSQPQRAEDFRNDLLQLVRRPRAIYEEIFTEAAKVEAFSIDSPRELAIIFSGLLDGLGTIYYEYSETECKKFYHASVTCLLNGMLKK